MNENFTITEQLIKYLDNELDEPQRLQLEQKIAGDAALKEELDNLRIAQQAVKSYGLKQKIASLHNEMMAEMKTERPAAKRVSIVRSIGWYGLRAAAAVIIVVCTAGVYEYSSLSSEKLYNDNYSQFTLTQTRGASDNDTLAALYNQHNAAAVIKVFENQTSPAAQSYFLAGNAYLTENKPAKAIHCFTLLREKNEQQQTHIYEEDAVYYLSLAYLQNNEPKKALPLFTEIYTDARHAYHDKVSKWQLQKLKWLTGRNEP